MQTEHLSHGIQYLTKDIILKAWVEIKDSIMLYIYIYIYITSYDLYFTGTFEKFCEA
jgi:hypothetical protein